MHFEMNEQLNLLLNLTVQNQENRYYVVLYLHFVKKYSWKVFTAN